MFRHSKSTPFPEADAFKKFLILIGILLILIFLLLLCTAYAGNKKRNLNPKQIPINTESNLAYPNGYLKITSLSSKVSSTIGGYREGLPVKCDTQRTDSTIRFSASNIEPLKLFKKALNLPERQWPDSRIMLEDLDVTRFFLIDGNEDRQQRAITYELVLPIERENELSGFMLQDICRYFGVKAEIKERETDCYYLVHESVGKVPSSKDNDRKEENNFTTEEDQAHFMKNSYLASLITYLNNVPGTMPVFDYTGITQKVDLDLGTDPGSIYSLNSALKPYGLAFKYSVRKMKMLVISPAGKN